MPAELPDPPCPAEEINRAIRAFLSDRDGRPLTPAERRQYEQLRARWLEAVRRRRVRAMT
ncbi:hypothetical protein [Streptomyces sp. I05A-00742]|uniref:hypothetical protein n=1 Tax=Streptomyces sp. I05A-00742 TaxID=2732853 RepID=UPI001489B11D|nr:hypothetical protein [Streptomyces sp. I05A-00742]